MSGTSGSWDLDLVVDQAWVPELKVGSDGVAHAVYHAMPGPVWRYARSDGGPWAIEEIDGSEHAGSLELVLDPLDVPHVAYRVSPDGEIVHAVLDAGAWESESVASQSAQYLLDIVRVASRPLRIDPRSGGIVEALRPPSTLRRGCLSTEGRPPTRHPYSGSTVRGDVTADVTAADVTPRR